MTESLQILRIAVSVKKRRPTICFNSASVFLVAGGQVISAVRAGAGASMVLERNGDLYKAPGRTQFKAGSCVRLPLDENVAPDAEERWYYGTVTRVYSGGELVDVKLDTGDECLCIPTWEVFSA